MKPFSYKIVCSYLYVITKYGYPPPAEMMLDHVREMHDLGFRTIELEGIRQSHLCAVFQRRRELAAEVHRLGMMVPFFCTVLPGLASSDAEERRANLDLFEKGCVVAHLLGSRGVLDNGPLPPYKFPGGIPITRHYDQDVLLSASLPREFDWNEYLMAMVVEYRKACDIAAEHSLSFNLHPSLGVFASNTDGFLRLYDSVGRENLRFVIDTANQFLQKENLVLAIRRLRGLVDYVHLSDNNGARMEHLVPGEGKISWEKVLDELAEGFDGFIAIDVGGEESGIADIDGAYRKTACWLGERWPRVAAMKGAYHEG